MTVSTDILRTWRAPRQVMRRLLEMGQREDRALAFLMAACLLMFASRLPPIARENELDGTIPLDAAIQTTLYAWIFIAPLFAYLLSFVVWLLLRIRSRRVRSYHARLALFWSFLATTPASLLFGLSQGLVGDEPATNLVGGFLLVGFLYIFVQSLREVLRACSDA